MPKPKGIASVSLRLRSLSPRPFRFPPIIWRCWLRAAFLHDIGKMAIPDSILRKPGPLDNDEKQIMRTHCDIGYQMLTRIPFLRDAAEIVLAHQEFYDGTGYPNGLEGRTDSARSAHILDCRCPGRDDQRPAL